MYDLGGQRVEVVTVVRQVPDRRLLSAKENGGIGDEFGGLFDALAADHGLRVVVKREGEAVKAAQKRRKIERFQSFFDLVIYV